MEEGAREVTATISEITMRGVMTIEFSEPLIIPDKYSEFDDSILGVRVIPDMRNFD